MKNVLNISNVLMVTRILSFVCIFNCFPHDYTGQICFRATFKLYSDNSMLILNLKSNLSHLLTIVNIPPAELQNCKYFEIS